jgi:hypothetical protein
LTEPTVRRLAIATTVVIGVLVVLSGLFLFWGQPEAVSQAASSLSGPNDDLGM